jgi:hypothetical protein
MTPYQYEQLDHEQRWARKRQRTIERCFGNGIPIGELISVARNSVGYAKRRLLERPDSLKYERCVSVRKRQLCVLEHPHMRFTLKWCQTATLWRPYIRGEEDYFLYLMKY